MTIWLSGVTTLLWFPGGIVRDLAVELVKQRRVCARALGHK